MLAACGVARVADAVLAASLRSGDTPATRRDWARRGTAVTHRCRPRAPIPGRCAARSPSGPRLHPEALWHTTSVHPGCREEQHRGAPLAAPPAAGDTMRRDRRRFGHAARGTAGSDTAGTRAGCHIVGTASARLQTCLAFGAGTPGMAPVRGRLSPMLWEQSA